MQVIANRTIRYNGADYKLNDVIDIDEKDLPQFTETGWGKVVGEKKSKKKKGDEG